MSSFSWNPSTPETASRNSWNASDPSGSPGAVAPYSARRPGVWPAVSASELPETLGCGCAALRSLRSFAAQLLLLSSRISRTERGQPCPRGSIISPNTARTRLSALLL